MIIGLVFILMNSLSISLLCVLIVALLISISLLLYFYFLNKKRKKNVIKNINELNKLLNIEKLDENNISKEELNTNLLNIENKITNLNDSLNKEKNKVNEVLNYFDEGILILDSNLNILLCNKYIYKTFHVKSNMINKNVIYLMLPININNLISNTKENNTNEFIYENKFYRLKISFFDNKNKIYFLLINEITKEKELEKTKKEFFENSSHELKTPLTIILAYEEMISNNLLNELEIKEANKIVYKNALLMKDIISNMLKLSSIENSINNKKENVYIKDIIYSYLEEVKINIENKKLKINLDIDNTSILIDKKDLYLLISNLISNAIQYNKINGFININLKDKILKIEDSGIGIKKENINKIFDRFYHINDNNFDFGSGIGLSIVKHIIKNYNFKIEVKSEENKGSIFIIYFK